MEFTRPEFIVLSGALDDEPALSFPDIDVDEAFCSGR